MTCIVSLPYRKTTYMRRISTLSLRAPQVTYFYVCSYRGTRDALNCSHLRRFTYGDPTAFQRCAVATLGYVRFSTRPRVILAFLVLLASCTVLQTTYIRRISALSLRASQVTYFYVRSYRGTHNALNCSYLRRFTYGNERQKT